MRSAAQDNADRAHLGQEQAEERYWQGRADALGDLLMAYGEE